LFFALTSLQLRRRDTLMYSLLIVAGQFVVMLLWPNVKGYFGWFLLALIFSKMVGVYHPPSEIEQPLDGKRIILGWLSLLIFVLCFTPIPIVLNVIIGKQ
jgi:hypothetical protein